MRLRIAIGAACATTLLATAAMAADTEVTIGYSGWTGFGPLTLAKDAGIYEKHGLDVTLKKIPQASRNLALASGDIQCAATTVETWIVWNAAGVPATQIFQLDKSHGADGIVVRNDIKDFDDLKGKTVAASAPGTAPYFLLAWMLNENGMSVDDVRIVNLEPGPAAQAFLAGQNDAAMTYEPYLSSVRDKPEAGYILATTEKYPAILDSFGCSPDWLKAHPDAAKALADSYFDVLKMIEAQPDKAHEIMGADVNQTAAEFADSAKYLTWADRQDSLDFFGEEYQEFAKKAAKILMDAGVIRSVPDLDAIATTKYIRQ